MIDPKEIQERLDKASEGPWFVGREIIDDGAVMCRVPAGICTPDGDDGKMNAVLCNTNFYLGNRENDNNFIAHAPADIKALLAEVERLEEFIADNEIVLKSANTDAENLLAYSKDLELQIKTLKEK